ncbi:DUF6443 domain-containing protein [Aquimarina sp. 2304DJ70-9]|uniref:DUF6443 domain-containing protein n=1 Tax=Aquimarina penaris TaxID=3231044 RepID=UPI003461BABA
MKKHIYILSMVFFCVVFVHGQTQTENYIRTTTFQEEISVLPVDYSDFSMNTGISDFLHTNAGGGGFDASMASNVLNINFNGGWGTGVLKLGVVKTLPLFPGFDTDVELGEMLTNDQPSGIKMKIRGKDLILYSNYFVNGIATHNTRQIPGNQSYLQKFISLSYVGACPDGNRIGEGYILINDDTITLHVGFNHNNSSRSDCKPYLGFIKTIEDVTLPDMELGTLRSTEGEDTVYKAKIWNNILVFYTDETIPAYPTSGAFSKTLDFNIEEPKSIKAITYFDGLGRSKQTIDIKAGGQSQDIVTPSEYDKHGRQIKEYLPYAKSSLGGNIHANVVTDQRSFYNTPKYENTTNPYNQQDFEKSPLDRVLMQAAPGEDWKLGNNHEIESEYTINTVPEVRKFDVQYANGSQLPQLLANTGSYYNPGELYKTITRNENHVGTGKNNTTEEFKDKLDRVILKRTYADVDTNNDGVLETEVPHDTYHVYDDFGNLTFVIPPGVHIADGISNEELNELCYQYRYDERNRLIEKKIPGKGDANTWEYIVYNKLDQPIMTQDPNQKANNQWLFAVYDAFGRVAYTGIDENSTSNRDVLQTAAYAASKQFVTKLDEGQSYAGTTVFYSKNAYPTSFDKVFTINYYDNYKFDIVGLEDPGMVFGTVTTDRTQLLPTGTKVRVLGTNDWITTVTYYDDKSRAIYVATKNEYLNTTTIVETQYDFVGNILKTRSRHQKGSNTEIVTVDTFTYDHMNRLLDHKQCIGDSTLSNDCGAANSGVTDNIELSESITTTTNKIASQSITLLPGFYIAASSNVSFSATIQNVQGELIAANTYDELGQLISKKVGNKESSPLQKVDYTYNVRGWLKGINDVNNLGSDLFAFGVNYNVVTESSSQANALYNGNISETVWKTANDNTKRSYSYQYDALDRITNAVSNDNKYDLHEVRYDQMGNITKLARNGWQNTTTYTDMDVLNYDYRQGNRLVKVTDTGNTNYGFKNGTNTNDDFSYDANGNLTLDQNKGITEITYNHLNLPKVVSVNSTGQNGDITYVYDANGIKIKKLAKEGSVVTTTDYDGNYIYENEEVQFINTPEGYLMPDESGNYQYVYRQTDIWRNSRISYTDYDQNGVITNSEIIREQNYYPFGLEHKGYNSSSSEVKNNYKTYQGQEFTENLNIDVHEWKYRISDPSTGRFWQIDPLAEEYTYNSTYAFQENKLGIGIELEGLEVSEFEDLNQTGQLLLGTANELINNSASLQGTNQAIFTFGLGFDKGAFSSSFGTPGLFGTEVNASLGELNAELQVTSRGEAILQANGSLLNAGGSADLFGDNISGNYTVIDGKVSYNLNTNISDSSLDVLEGSITNNNDNILTIGGAGAYIKTNLNELQRSFNDFGVAIKSFFKAAADNYFGGERTNPF